MQEMRRKRHKNQSLQDTNWEVTVLDISKNRANKYLAIAKDMNYHPHAKVMTENEYLTTIGTEFSNN